HQVKNEWGGAHYPMVPGHEIVGRVLKTGSEVKRFKTGDLAGIGCMVNSCRHCNNCKKGLEQFCENGMTGTYNSMKEGAGAPTYGGYSKMIVANEYFVLNIPANLPLEGVAPLLCAGITTFSPMRHWKVGKGHTLGVIGLGGLGHMAVKLAASFGAEVTMLSTSPEKEKDARYLGAHHFALTKDPAQLKKLINSFDFIIDTVSAEHDYDLYIRMLRTDGVMICVGAPPTPPKINPLNLIGNRRSMVGSLIGGIPETQEMLDYCGEHNIVSDVEVIRMDYINEAYKRMLKGDVKYRFVVDMATL
ncbi:MAG: NAD(P)-dependent alcohol dehydrogenase, partial [Flavitalea sp.]